MGWFSRLFGGEADKTAVQAPTKRKPKGVVPQLRDVEKAILTVRNIEGISDIKDNQWTKRTAIGIIELKEDEIFIGRGAQEQDKKTNWVLKITESGKTYLQIAANKSIGGYISGIRGNRCHATLKWDPGLGRYRIFNHSSNLTYLDDYPIKVGENKIVENHQKITLGGSFTDSAFMLWMVYKN